MARWFKKRHAVILATVGIVTCAFTYTALVGWGHVFGLIGYRLGFLGSIEVGDCRLVMAEGWFPASRENSEGREILILSKSDWPTWTPSNSIVVIKHAKEEPIVLFKEGPIYMGTKKYAWGEVRVLRGSPAVFFVERGITVAANRGYEDRFESALNDILTIQ